MFTSLKDDSYGGDTNNDGSTTTPAAGNWDGVVFRDPSDDAVCKLDNCVIRYGGASFSGSLQANVKCERASPTISNNELSYSATHGIYLDGSSPQISGNVIANNLNIGIFVLNGSSPIINGNSIFSNSGFGLINGTTSSNINAHQNWWGDATGPLDNSDDRATGGLYNPSGLGNQVSDYVDYDPWLTAPGTGNTVPDIAVNPTSHNYGNVGIGSNVSQTFAVSNQGTTALQVTATTLAGADANQFSIASGGAPFTLAAAQSQNLVVNFTPTSAGAKSANLQIASNDPNENPFSVNLTGTGLSVPQMSINDVTITEGNSGTVNAVFTVTLSAASSQQITVDYATANGTATAGTDYVAIPTTQLIIPANTSSQTITVEVNGDLLDEVDETFFVNLSNATNAVITDNQGQGLIINDDPQPALSINDVTVTEGNTGTVNATFTVSLSAASGKQVTVDYATADGTATAGSDYVAIPITQLIFPAGTTTQTISVTVNGEVLSESNETFFVNLSNPANATLVDGQGQGMINDDDAQITISINDVTVTEGNAGTVNAIFTLSLSATNSQQVTVNYATANGTATAGSDYVAIPTTQLIFPPNTTTKTITVVVNGDLFDEPDETFFVNLTNAAITDAQGVGTITDDDAAPSISINDVTITEGNTGMVNAVFTVSLSAASGQVVTLNYATANGTAIAGSDYVVIPTTLLTFPANTTTQTITVLVNGDVANEPNETFFVNLSNPNNATIADAQGVGTINNDDVLPVTIVLNPSDDAYVRSNQPTTNFGTATVLILKQSAPILNSYLKFVISGVSGTVQSAKLRLKVTVASASGGSVFSVSNNLQGTSTPWTQSSLNYSNAPIISGTPLFTVGSVTVGQVVEFDVTSAVTGNNTYSFGLNNASTTAVQYSSKEGTTKPELSIQFLPLPPVITAFTPSSGAVGTQVTITGNNFTGATQVAFNGVVASVFTVNSITQITATVPTGATTGKITVTTPGGTATSSTNFIVTPPPIVLNPTDDAFVRSDQPTTNNGTATTLRMKQSSPIINSYLKFTVSGVSGTVLSAKLRLAVTVASSSGGSVFAVSNNQQGTSTPWTQSNLNYSNAPIISGTPLFTVGSVTVGQVVEFDVKAAITGNGTFSFGLNNASTTAVQYSSKEGATKPELVIQTGTGTAAKIADLGTEAVALENVEAALPKEFMLSANYPNPFNAQTVIEYALPEAVQVRLVIFNVLGQHIRRLVDENQSAGYKRVIWDGRNEFGQQIGSGIYFLQMNVGRQKFVRKMFLQR